MTTRVFYYVSNYHRFTGSQRSLFLLLGGIDRSRYEPFVVFPGDGPSPRAFRAAGVDVHIEPPPPLLDEFGGGLLRASNLTRARLLLTAVLPYSVKISRLIRSVGARVAHFNNTRSMLMAGLGAIVNGVPKIWHVRSDERGLGIYSKTCAALADRIILVADGINSTVPPRFQAKCRTVHNGIDPPVAPSTRTRASLLASLRPPLEMEDDSVLVVVVGSVVPFKGAHHLLEAVAVLMGRNPGARRRLKLVFVGDRPVPAYERLLDELVTRHGLENTRFAGWDDEPLDWVRAADVVALPTVESERLELDGELRTVHGTEGFSRSVLEAMICAKPVVASAVAGVPEQVTDRVTGLLVPPSDPGRLAEALETAVGWTGEERRAIGRAAEERVLSQFSVRAMAQKTMAVYDELFPPRRA